MAECHMSCTPVARHARYGRDLRFNVKTTYYKLRPSTYALKDCNDLGELTIKFVIIEVKTHNNISTYSCSCEQDNCLHVNALKELPEPECVFVDGEEHTYAFLGENRFGVYCESNPGSHLKSRVHFRKDYVFGYLD